MLKIEIKTNFNMLFLIWQVSEVTSRRYIKSYFLTKCILILSFHFFNISNIFFLTPLVVPLLVGTIPIDLLRLEKINFKIVMLVSALFDRLRYLKIIIWLKIVVLVADTEFRYEVFISDKKPETPRENHRFKSIFIGSALSCRLVDLV